MQGLWIIVAIYGWRSLTRLYGKWYELWIHRKWNEIGISEVDMRNCTWVGVDEMCMCVCVWEREREREKERILKEGQDTHKVHIILYALRNSPYPSSSSPQRGYPHTHGWITQSMWSPRGGKIYKGENYARHDTCLSQAGERGQGQHHNAITYIYWTFPNPKALTLTLHKFHETLSNMHAHIDLPTNNAQRSKNTHNWSQHHSNNDIHACFFNG